MAWSFLCRVRRTPSKDPKLRGISVRRAESDLDRIKFKKKEAWKIRTTYISVRYNRWFSVPEVVFVWNFDLESDKMLESR